MTINPKFRALIPPLAPEELSGLEAALLSDGCRDPLVTWRDTLIDGHNRYEICTRHGIAFKTMEIEFESDTHARVWMRNNQRSRRNLSDAWKIELELGNKEDLAEIGRSKNKATVGRPAKESLSNNDNDLTPEPKHDTRKEIAKAAGVSTGKIAQAEVVKKKSPELWEKAKAGEITVHAAYKAATVHVGQNSGDNEWYTPPDYIAAARATMGGIDCDPASSEIANKTVAATVFFTKDDDGLSKKWSGRVWMNPPYAQPLMGQFAESVSAKFETGEINQACILCNNATETKWFNRMARIASAICFPEGRIKFLDANGKPGAPLQGQAIIYLGENVPEFMRDFSGFGFVLINQ
jgi:DNA N-6-adenine-methyltransferase (Dam)